MTLEQLIAEFRVLAFDMVEPYLFSDDSIIHWLNDAVREACIRGRLLHVNDDPDICQIAIETGRTNYQTHASLYEITHASLEVAGERTPICLISHEDMSAIDRHWRWEDNHLPHLIQFDTYVRLSHVPHKDAVLHLEAYCVPKTAMSADDMPAIHAIHHPHLLDWALHKAFGIPDSEVFDINKSQMAEMRFTQYFGIRPDSDLRRITRHDVHHTVQAFWV